MEFPSTRLKEGGVTSKALIAKAKFTIQSLLPE